jgi:hypothetical protein
MQESVTFSGDGTAVAVRIFWRVNVVSFFIVALTVTPYEHSCFPAGFPSSKISQKTTLQTLQKSHISRR